VRSICKGKKASVLDERAYDQLSVPVGHPLDHLDNLDKAQWLGSESSRRERIDAFEMELGGRKNEFEWKAEVRVLSS
jgi:hypothetical protein